MTKEFKKILDVVHKKGRVNNSKIQTSMTKEELNEYQNILNGLRKAKKLKKSFKKMDENIDKALGIRRF